MAFKYCLDERPPLRHMVLYSLQWFVITVPFIIILGKVAAGGQGALP